MIRTMMRYIREFKRAAIATPVFMILEVIMEVIIPLMMSSIVDKGVEAGNIGHIYKMGIFMFMAALFSLTVGILGGKYGAKASAGLERNLRQGMYDNIQTYAFSNIDKYSTAGLVTRLTTDVTNVQNAFQMSLRMGTRAPASLLFAMFMAFTIDARIASVYLGAVLFLGTCLFLIMRRTTRYFDQVFKKYDDLNSSVQENASSIRVVKAFVREEYEKGKFKSASENVYKMFVNAEKILVLNSPLMQLTVYSCILLISWIGAKFIVAQSLTTGQLMNLLTYCMNILMSLMMLSMIFVMLTMSSASMKRIAEVLNEKADIENPQNPVTQVKDGSITFENVDFAYNKTAEKPVLSNIIGGTGSAKTSLVNLISRLYDVTGGAVLVGGRDVREYDLEVLRNEVSVVLQKNVLFSGTILENLRWGDENASEKECIRACQLACADEFIQKMPEKYNTYIEQGGTNVSGGRF